LQQRKDPQVLEEQQQAVNERMHAILQKAQSRLSELVCTSIATPMAANAFGWTCRIPG